MGDTLPRRRIVRVSASLLREWILLPEGCEVVNAEMDTDGSALKLTVEQKQIPITADGAEIPLHRLQEQTIERR